MNKKKANGQTIDFHSEIATERKIPRTKNKSSTNYSTISASSSGNNK